MSITKTLFMCGVQFAFSTATTKSATVFKSWEQYAIYKICQEFCFLKDILHYTINQHIPPDLNAVQLDAVCIEKLRIKVVSVVVLFCHVLNIFLIFLQHNNSRFRSPDKSSEPEAVNDGIYSS